MSYSISIEPEAEADLADAFSWYEKQQRGLGGVFLHCVRDVFDRIRTTPELHAIAYNGVRQTLVKRFPFVVCYLFEGDCVDVIAVFHGQRDPKDWQSRVS